MDAVPGVLLEPLQASPNSVFKPGRCLQQVMGDLPWLQLVFVVARIGKEELIPSRLLDQVEKKLFFLAAPGLDRKTARTAAIQLVTFLVQQHGVLRGEDGKGFFHHSRNEYDWEADSACSVQGAEVNSALLKAPSPLRLFL